MRFVVIALRVVALFCLVGFMFQLRFSGKKLPQAQTLHVLIDHSKSMEDEASQIKKVIDVLDRWAGTHQWKLRFFGFSKKPQEARRVEEILGFPYGERTALGATIREMDKVLEKNSGVFVLSDGLETEDQQKIPQTGLGIFTVAFGGEPMDDIVLSEVVVPSVIFARGQAPIKLEIRYPRGLREALALNIHDAKTKETIFLSTITLNGFSPQQVSLNVGVGRLIGKKEWIFQIGSRDWETDATNNRRIVAVNIRREKLRVLYIAGKPTLDYSYLRDFLRSESGRELVSFVILRNPEDVPPLGEPELSLIPFPAQDLFLKNLSEFDLFILHDFSFRRFGLPSLYMAKIVDFIRQGGGFLLLAGSQTLDDEYARFFEEVFGVFPIRGLREGAFEPSIADHKSWNKIFSYYSDSTENLAFWKKAIPSINAFQEMVFAGDAKKSLVLAATRIDQTTYPLIVTSRLGSGRACLQSFVGSWLWKAKNSVAGSADSYDFYWQSLLDWVTQEDVSSRRSPIKESFFPAESNPETRASFDYDYLERLSSLNRGALLGRASDWMKEVNPQYEEKILRFFEENSSLASDTKKPWSFTFDEKALWVAIFLLVLEWFLRRFWIGEDL